MTAALAALRTIVELRCFPSAYRKIVLYIFMDSSEQAPQSDGEREMHIYLTGFEAF